MTGVQAYLTMTGGSFDTDLVTERIGLAPDILKRREAGPHGEVSTEWGIRTELEISPNVDVVPVLRSLLCPITCGPCSAGFPAVPRSSVTRRGSVLRCGASG